MGRVVGVSPNHALQRAHSRVTAEAVGPNRQVGVYYAPQDYAGLARRLIVIFLDALVLAVILAGVLAVSGVLGVQGPAGAHGAAAVFVASAFGYLVVLGNSHVGTLGYMATGVRVVDLMGGRPSLLQMTARVLFAGSAWLNVLLEVWWLGGDADRQALHDKLAGTYVVRKGAHPLGQGEQRYVLYDIGGWTWIFREVSRHVT